MTDLVPLNDLERMAQAMAGSGLFGVKTPQQALALMLISHAEGRHPALAAKDYDIIQGKPAKKADAMLRDFLSAGGKVEWHTLNDSLADATFSHPQGGTFRCDWDMKRAATAGFAGKDNWKKFPRAMLRSRVVSEGVRTVFPMATSGMYVPEEVQDFTPSETMREVNDRPKRVTADPLAGQAAPDNGYQQAMQSAPQASMQDYAASVVGMPKDQGGTPSPDTVKGKTIPFLTGQNTLECASIGDWLAIMEDIFTSQESDVILETWDANNIQFATLQAMAMKKKRAEFIDRMQALVNQAHELNKAVRTPAS